MKSTSLIISCLVYNILTATAGWPHGVEGNVEIAEGWCLSAKYDDGEPMNYAAVEIRAPDTKLPFQSGRTDRNGCFLFKPDGPGQWQVVVADGMGHQASLDISVGGDEKSVQKKGAVLSPVASGEGSRPLKIIVGLSVIFGLCGVLYGWKARRSPVGSKTS
jgi:nickel transport protein